MPRDVNGEVAVLGPGFPPWRARADSLSARDLEVREFVQAATE